MKCAPLTFASSLKDVFKSGSMLNRCTSSPLIEPVKKRQLVGNVYIIWAILSVTLSSDEWRTFEQGFSIRYYHNRLIPESSTNTWRAQSIDSSLTEFDHFSRANLAQSERGSEWRVIRKERYNHYQSCYSYRFCDDFHKILRALSLFVRRATC